MAIELDHVILTVGDRARSLDFYTGVLGLTHEGEDGPFSKLRVTPGLLILLAPGDTRGGEHLAFSMSKAEFDAAFGRIEAAGVAFGDRYDRVGSMRGPGEESGARGMGKSLYLFDPDAHLIEIRHYDDRSARWPDFLGPGSPRLTALRPG